jgi:hypothetical protein
MDNAATESVPILQASHGAVTGDGLCASWHCEEGDGACLR